MHSQCCLSLAVQRVAHKSHFSNMLMGMLAVRKTTLRFGAIRGRCCLLSSSNNNSLSNSAFVSPPAPSPLHAAWFTCVATQRERHGTLCYSVECQCGGCDPLIGHHAPACKITHHTKLTNNKFVIVGGNPDASSKGPSTCRPLPAHPVCLVPFLQLYY